MKKILLSLAMILFVGGAVALGGTGSFFSDTETSTGNTFTAGAIDLKVDNHSYYNGAPNPGTTWELKDLNTTIDKFFNFSDIKPGDVGEDTVSLHVDTNDAYLCANMTLTSNDDNTCNPPELLDDPSCTAPGTGQGELASNVNFIWWADDGDNVLESGEKVISQGPLSALSLNTPYPVTLADSTTNIWTGNGGPISGGQNLYIGKAWCFGTIGTAPITQDNSGVLMSPAGNNDGNGTPGQATDGGITCSGLALNNATQTDILTADVSFSAVQARNNPGFKCTGTHCPIDIQTNVALADAGFETPLVNTPQLWNTFPSPVGGWNVQWRDPLTTTFGTQNRPAIANLELHRGVLGLASQGDQYAELDSDWGGPSDSGTGEPASVTVYQDITTVPGKQYEVRYAFAPRPDTPASENDLEFRFGGNVINDTGPTVGPSGAIQWQQKDFTMTATTTTTRIEFTDLGTSNSAGTFLDDVRVYTEKCNQ